MSVTAALPRTVRAGVVLATTLGLALMIPAGFAIALPLILLPESVRTACYAFGLIAFLYLVTEELLVEAHKHEEPLWATALFFVGFMGLTILDEILRPV
jgi:ZIP family zinc transporter